MARSFITPSSNSRVVTAAVEPGIKILTSPERIPESLTACSTSGVILWQSPSPLVFNSFEIVIMALTSDTLGGVIVLRLKLSRDYITRALQKSIKLGDGL